MKLKEPIERYQEETYADTEFERFVEDEVRHIKPEYKNSGYVQFGTEEMEKMRDYVRWLEAKVRKEE